MCADFRYVVVFLYKVYFLEYKVFHVPFGEQDFFFFQAKRAANEVDIPQYGIWNQNCVQCYRGGCSKSIGTNVIVNCMVCESISS